MKKTVIGIVVALAAAALIVVFCGPVAAKVTGVCSNCHTMHDSQGGAAMANGGPHATLLMNSCVGCHSSGVSSTTYALGGSNVPVVNYTSGSAPTTYLAGGNFYWVAQTGGDAKGHNILGISGQDVAISASAGAPGNPYNCANSCHKTLAVAQTADSSLGSGCEGCHLNVQHHADDSATVVGASQPSTDGYYRFLSGHMSGKDNGVCGVEDNDWQATNSATDHNEYLGFVGDKTASADFNNLGNTMTAFCCGCHGNFHEEQNASGAWIRHPSDAKIPITGEYAAYVVYDPLSPVARPDLTGWTGPSSSVNEGGTVSKDMVMCLSCHRPHGSPFDDLLRWDYGAMQAGGGNSTTGCFACHTTKDTGG